MKKINTNGTLSFAKSSLVELNDGQLYEVNGGTTAVCLSITLIVVYYMV